MGKLQLGKSGRFRCGILVRCIVLVLMAQFMMVPSLGLAQDDFNCPITLNEDDCAVLQAAQMALDEAGSVQVEAFDLALSIDLDNDSQSFSGRGSGDIVLEDGEIVAADFYFDEAMYISAETAFEGEAILRLVDGVIHIGGVEDDGAVEWIGAEIDAILPELGFLDGFVTLFEELQDVPTVITWGRDEDFVVDETLVAVFYMDFSARGLLQSSAFVEWLATSLAETFADSFEEDLISPSLATAIVSELSNQFSQDIGDDYIFRVTQLISLEDFQLQRFTVEIDFTMDLGFLAGFGASVEGDSPESLHVVIDFDATLGDYGGDVVIEAPETYDDISDDIAEYFDGLLMDVVAGIGSGDNGDSGATIDGAVDLVVDEPIMGMIAADGEPNRYRFEAAAGDIVQVGVRADVDSNLDTYLQLFDEEGERLADNDDAMSPPSEFDLGAFDSYIEYEIEEDGVYVVEVSSVFVGDAGAYTLMLQIE